MHLNLVAAIHSIALAEPLPQPLPDVLWLGIGCKCGTSAALIRHAIDTVCQDYCLSKAAIACVATLEGKEAEMGLLEFCAAQQWPISFLSVAALRGCSGPHPSARAKAAVGTPSVAEAAALLTAKRNGAVSLLVVPKQSFQWIHESGAVTLAIAQSKNPVQNPA